MIERPARKYKADRAKSVSPPAIFPVPFRSAQAAPDRANSATTAAGTRNASNRVASAEGAGRAAAAPNQNVMLTARTADAAAKPSQYVCANSLNRRIARAMRAAVSASTPFAGDA